MAEGPSKRRSRTLHPRTLDELPLFASDREIAEAVVGADPARVADFLGKIPTLEKDRFPPVDGFYGGRFTPHVKAFFFDRADRRHPPPPIDPQGSGSRLHKNWNR